MWIKVKSFHVSEFPDPTLSCNLKKTSWEFRAGAVQKSIIQFASIRRKNERFCSAFLSSDFFISSFLETVDFFFFFTRFSKMKALIVLCLVAATFGFERIRIKKMLSIRKQISSRIGLKNYLAQKFAQRATGNIALTNYDDVSFARGP